MSAVTHSVPWTSNGKPRYIPCRCPAPTVAAATLCQSPCSPFSPKGYIARYGKKLIINNEKQTYRQSKMITDATYSNVPFPKNAANRFNGRGRTCRWLTLIGCEPFSVNKGNKVKKIAANVKIRGSKEKFLSISLDI